MREPSVALAHSTRGWAQELHFFLMDHGGAIVRGYVMSSDDVVAESYDVLIVDDVTSFLSYRLVSALRGRGVRVIGVYDESDARGAGKQRLLEIGVDEALPASTTPSEFVQVITRLAGPFVEDDPELAGLLGDLGARTAPPRPSGGDADEAPGGGPRRGRVVAVAAAAGGAGATEIAIGIAGAVRDHGLSAVLCDTDDQAPAIAQRLGLGLHPNIRTAVDAVHHGTTALESTLARSTDLGIEVLCGLPNPRDWYELRAVEVAEVLAELASVRPLIVANVGPRIDDLPNLGGPARFGVTRAVVGMADVVVLVGVASPLGVRRIIDWLADARSLIASTPLQLVINQYPGGAFAIGEIEVELRRTVTPQSLTIIPSDPRVSRAGWDGVPVPRGKFSKAVAGLATHLVPAEVSS
jgi:MinD-like ATPase involved in chromosome partitioning or flagellar assembly